METETKPQPPESDEESDHSSEEEDELGDDQQLQGRTKSKAGIEVNISNLLSLAL